MERDLKELEDRLEKHFSCLRDKRLQTNVRLFVFEHGLNNDEIDNLSSLIREHITSTYPSSEFWLAWIIYATEIGYDYDGTEYWQSFSKLTPKWEYKGNRNQLKLWFRKFEREYFGFIPSGAWANHFSIICWPITHAILPKDLQLQLAQLLYKVRYGLTSDLINSPEELGQFLASRCWDQTSRFIHFSQQPLFLGQIASALLLHNQANLSSLLLQQDTLSRIIADLESEKNARNRFRKTKDHINKTKLKGLRETYSSTKVKSPDEVRSQNQRLNITPRLMLRKINKTDWDVFLELPDFTPLVNEITDLYSIIAESRCRVNSASGKPLAPGRLLGYGKQQVKLSRWPNPREVLIDFEEATPELNFILKSECLLETGPTWLFIISNDGYAYNLKTKVVRPNKSYVVVGKYIDVLDRSYFKQITLLCDGVNAIYLEIPALISDEMIKTLSNIGLDVASSIRFFPIGIPPHIWDGDGYVEWLISDIPHLAIQSSHRIKSAQLKIEGTSEQIDLSNIDRGENVFIQFDNLQIGVNKLTVSAELDDGQQASALLNINVREPRQWLPGQTQQNALIVIYNPRNPSLEDIWNGEISLEVHGPSERGINIIFKLYSRNQQACLSEVTSPKLKIPVSSEQFHSFFEREIQENKNIQRTFDRAYSCELIITAGALGEYKILAERKFTPLRWSVDLLNSGYTIELLDDTGTEKVAAIHHYLFDTPDVALDIGTEYQNSFFHEVQNQGGMYVASSNLNV